MLMTSVVLGTIQKNVTYSNESEEVLGKLQFHIWSQRRATVIGICHGISRFLRKKKCGGITSNLDMTTSFHITSN